MLCDFSPPASSGGSGGVGGSDAAPGQGQEGRASLQLVLENPLGVLFLFLEGRQLAKPLGSGLMMVMMIINKNPLPVLPPPARDHGEQQEQAQRPQPAPAQPGAGRQHPPRGVPGLADTQQSGCPRSPSHPQPLLRDHGRRVQALRRLQHLRHRHVTAALRGAGRSVRPRRARVLAVGSGWVWFQLLLVVVGSLLWKEVFLFWARLAEVFCLVVGGWWNRRVPRCRAAGRRRSP